VTWHGPTLDDDQRDLIRMLDALAADRGPLLGDDTTQVADLVGELAGLGLWTVGAGEANGGGGADRLTAGLVHERLGRTWPALAWAAVQAQVAADLLGEHPVVPALHAGTVRIAVVDAASSRVHLTREDERLTGTVDRVDAASEEPHVLLLTGDDTAVLIGPEATTRTAVHRTGLAGALTRSLEVDASVGESAEDLTGLDVTAARTTLLLGTAAVAAGIAAVAAEEAVSYAGGRVQFGGPLTALPIVRQSLLTQMSGATVALASALGAPAEPVAALAAARSACDTAIEVSAAALQSHGGYGYLTEYAAERHLRDAVSLRAASDLTVAERTTGLALVGRPSANPPRKEAS